MGKHVALADRPGILVAGPARVGKSTLAARIVSSSDTEAMLESDASWHGWTIDTKYYTADVAISIKRTGGGEGERGRGGGGGEQMDNSYVALVMVFDMANVTSFHTLKNWASKKNLSAFDILLCVGNKADKLLDHPGHVTYRRRLLRKEETQNLDSSDFGIQRTEGTSLLVEREESDKYEEEKVGVDKRKESEERGESGGDDSYEKQRQMYTDWCTDNGIEFIESCALNSSFDRGIATNGDRQGVERIREALSAHMWPGLQLKNVNRVSIGGNIPVMDMDMDMDGEGSSSEEEEDLINQLDYELLVDDEKWENRENGIENDFLEENESTIPQSSQSESIMLVESELLEKKAVEVNFELDVSSNSVDGPLSLPPDFSEKWSVEQELSGQSLSKNENEMGSNTSKSYILEDQNLEREREETKNGEGERDLCTRELVNVEREGDSGNQIFEEEVTNIAISKETGSREDNSREDNSREDHGRKDNGREENSREDNVNYEELERIMNEMGAVRMSLGRMPDESRREMAAKLALQVARLFDNEDFDDF